MQSYDKKIDVNKPVENPDLKKAFEKFVLNRTEENYLVLMNEIKDANFLVLIITDEIKTKETI